MKFKIPVFIFLLAAAFASCQKQDDPTVVPVTTQLNLVNLSADAVNIFQNGNRLNNLNAVYPNGASGYLDAAVGDQVFQFRKMGSPNVLFNLPLKLDSAVRYSLFATGLTAEETFLVNDTYTPDTGRIALIRFINASRETGNLDLIISDTIKTNPTIIKYEDKAFKSVSAFIKVPIRNGSKQLKLLRTGGSTLLTDTVSLQSGNVYTIFARGKNGDTGDGEFGAGIIIN